MKTKLNIKQIIIAALSAGAVSAALNAAIYFIFKSNGIINDSIFVQPNQPLTLAPVIISSLLPSLVGGLIFFALEKYSNNGFRIFSTVALVFLIASFAMPYKMIPDVTNGYAMVMNAMHMVVAISLLTFIYRKVKSID